MVRMTRRQVLGALVGSASILEAACALPDSQVCANVAKVEADEDVVILWFRAGAALARGVRISHRAYQDDQAGVYSVSPDGQSVAWAPKFGSHGTSAPVDRGDPSLPLFSFSGVERVVRSIMLAGHSVVGLAVSNGGRRVLVLASVLGASKFRLLSFDVSSDRGCDDLTGFASGVPLSDVNRVRLCGKGAYAALGVGAEVVVLDLSRGSIVFRSKGRDPSISPDGARVAFLDGAHGLVIRDIVGSRAVRLLGSIRITGIATWSPDGRVLILGAEMVSLPPWRLLALDVSRGSFCVLADLPEGATGAGPVWIARRLASV